MMLRRRNIPITAPAVLAMTAVLVAGVIADPRATDGRTGQPRAKTSAGGIATASTDPRTSISAGRTASAGRTRANRPQRITGSATATPQSSGTSPATPAGTSTGALDPAGSQSVTFAADPAAVNNPERGFFEGFDSPVTVAQLSGVRTDGFTLAHLDINLGAFRGGALSAGLLAEVQADFDAARQAGIKLIPRFAYDFTAAGNDAPLPIVQEHISQLAPLLRAGSDVLLYLDAGFIGAWGEWHNSVNNLITHVVGGAEQVNDSTRQIVAALLAALPGDRSILVRTQRYKYALTGTANLTAAAAFGTSDAARIGFHNDCLFADSTDAGTYLARATDESWLSAETRYVAISGETCSADSQAQPLLDCPRALGELASLHWNSLNTQWYQPAVAVWRNQGCWWQIQQRLGYRLALTSMSTANIVAAGGTLPVSFGVDNTGFSTLHNPRPVDLVLRPQAGGPTRVVPLPVDPRLWAAGTTSRVSTAVGVPADLPSGSYRLSLWLPDPASGLQDKPAYAVHLANVGVWDAATGENDTGLSIVVR